MSYVDFHLILVIICSDNQTNSRQTIGEKVESITFPHLNRRISQLIVRGRHALLLL